MSTADMQPAAAAPAAAESGGDHDWVYWALGALVVILMVIGLITYSGKKNTEQAQAKAQELTQKFQAAGLRVPQDQDIITRSLGTDGGAVCDNPANALGRALLFDQITNGASFAGRRPVITDPKVVQGELLILQTYCPDKAQQYKQKITDKLKLDDTLKG
ncbi:MAG TPA: hypothetical protein VM684_17015 [Gaiellales bacterium]|nr:hypothetical protein [Gaiellales bacterium]HVI37939.1 hypothetical protein [Gaiellales bacterium]